MRGCRSLVGRTVATMACGLLAACPASAPCSPISPTAAGPCPDLEFRGHAYRAVQAIRPPRILEELGDGTYPRCAARGQCSRDRLVGLGATDVWALPGVDASRAVIGLRRGTHRYVVYVRVGVDPSTISTSRRR